MWYPQKVPSKRPPILVCLGLGGAVRPARVGLSRAVAGGARAASAASARRPGPGSLSLSLSGQTLGANPCGTGQRGASCVDPAFLLGLLARDAVERDVSRRNNASLGLRAAGYARAPSLSLVAATRKAADRPRAGGVHAETIERARARVYARSCSAHALVVRAREGGGLPLASRSLRESSSERREKPWVSRVSQCLGCARVVGY